MIAEGFVHGRFQPPHHEHVRYALEAKKRCEHLYIGLTNFDLYSLGSTPSAPHRAEASSNPFTYFERLTLWKAIMSANSVSASEFTVVPFPIDTGAQCFTQFIPNTVHAFVTVLDEWNREKNAKLEAAGFDITVLWDLSGEKRSISGEHIRGLAISHDVAWRSLVPECTLPILEKYGFG